MKRPPVTTRKRVPRPAFSFAASPPSTSTTSQLLAPSIIAQQRGCVVQVDDEDIDISIVVVIGEGNSPTHLLYGHARSSRVGNVDEHGQAVYEVIAKQLIALAITGSGGGIIDLRKHMAVGDEQIEIAVVVAVEERSAAAVGLEDVLLVLWGTRNVDRLESGDGALFGEMRLRHGGKQSAGRHQQLSGCVQPE